MKISKKLKVMLAVAMMGVGILAVPAGGVWGDVTCPEGTVRAKEYAEGKVSTNSVKSATQCNVPANEGEGTTEERNVFYYVNQIINVALGVTGLIAVVMIILSGIQIATANGDPGKVERGKKSILWAVVGLVIALLAFAIVNFVLANVFN